MASPTNKAAINNKIFALEAFEHVHNEHVPKYLELAQIIDDQVRDSEPGMLVHALSKSSENPTETVFRWLEVFENAAALETHLNNPAVVAHIEKLSAGILSDTTDIVIYAHWDNETTSYWQEKLSAINLRFADMESGFFLER